MLNLEPDNRDSLIFKIELTDKNGTKEQHLPYSQLLSKGNGNVQVKDGNRSDAFSLERKIVDAKNRDIIYMLWDECIEKTFYKHICENDNFIYLNGKNVLYSKTAQIVLDYLNKDAPNIVRLRKCLQNHMNTVQFGYSRCFPEIYSLIDKRGINLKSEYLLTFKLWKDKKKFSTISTNEKKSED